MRVYYLFTYYDFYPKGGFGDFFGNYTTVEDALKDAMVSSKDSYEIVEIWLDRWHMVEEGRCSEIVVDKPQQ